MSSPVLPRVEDMAGVIGTKTWTDLARRGHDGRITIGRDLVRIPARRR